MSLEIQETNGTVCFRVRVQPRASRNAFGAEWNGALKVYLTAPAVEDRANEALCRFLAEGLNVSQTAVRISSGARSRSKQVQVRGVSGASVLALAVAQAR